MSNEINKARVHLHTALVQVCDSDDQIIVGHMRAAYALLGGDLDRIDRLHSDTGDET